jgi:homoserine O-acetyltransferase
MIRPTLEGDFTFSTDAPFALDCGGALQPVTLHYALYGPLSPQRDNVVLVCHALSGSARVADWWADMFGPEGAFDTGRYCFLCSNVLGSCYGSTGPTSPDSRTGRPYGPDFPMVTIADMVRAQARLLDHLRIERARTVLGASIGGMQALQWAIDFPDRIGTCVSIGSTALSAMGLALNHLQRQAILNDAAYCDGRYADQPARGLGLARAIAMISYKSAALFTERYGRNPDRSGEDPNGSLHSRFDMAGYLDHQGEKFISRFDANSYLIISKAMDLFDPARQYGSEEAALRRIRSRVLLIGISSDWLFPPEDVRALADRMRAAGVNCTYAELDSDHGHDGFLADPRSLTALLRPALELNPEVSTHSALTAAGDPVTHLRMSKQLAPGSPAAADEHAPQVTSCKPRRPS